MATQLPVLPDVERLSPRVIRVLGGNPNKFTLQGTNTYLVGTGPSRILIDTAQGLPGWRASLSSVLRSENCTVGTTLLTHWHHDHVLGLEDLLSLCPSSTVYKAYLPVPKEGFHEDYAPPEFEHALINDGQRFETEGATLRSVYTPGHTTDHMAFVLTEEDDAMFSGDNVLGHGTAVFENLLEYLQSLDSMRLAVGERSRLYPGHGAVIKMGRDKIEEYIAHRKKREEEILKAMRGMNGGRGTSMEIVKVVYRDVPEHLHEPAEKGVKQVLAKLKAEGSVVESEGRWKIAHKAAL